MRIACEPALARGAGGLLCRRGGSNKRPKAHAGRPRGGGQHRLTIEDAEARSKGLGKRDFDRKRIERARRQRLAVYLERGHRLHDLVDCQRASVGPLQVGPQLERVGKVVGRCRPRLGEPGLELAGAAVHAHQRRLGEPFDCQGLVLREPGERAAARGTRRDGGRSWWGRRRGGAPCGVSGAPGICSPPDEKHGQPDGAGEAKRDVNPRRGACQLVSSQFLPHRPMG